MGGNPFGYQRPVGELIDREEELDALQRAAADRVAVSLVSPRRFGKTSLLHAHLAAMRAAGHRACFIDLDRVTSVVEVADRIVDGLATLPDDPQRRLGRRLDRLGMSIGPAGLTIQLGPRERRTPSSDEARSAIRDVLGLVGEVAGGDLTVVAIDEFQDLLVADDRLDGLLRSVIQRQDDVAYIFAGSRPSLMRELFGDRERPFYGQARPVHLPRLPDDATMRFLLERLPEGAAVDEAAAAVVQIGNGHPQRTMLLAHHLFDLLERGAAGEAAAAGALDAALRELDDGLTIQWERLDRAERLVVTAFAAGVSPTTRSFAAEHGMARSTLQRAVERVRGDEQLTDPDTGKLLDPLFAEWLRRAP